MAERDTAKYHGKSAVKKGMAQVRPRLREQGPNPDATAPPRGGANPAKGAAAITLTPIKKNRVESVLGRLSGEGARGGADVMKKLANCLLDMAERLDGVDKAGQLPEIPTEARDPPLTRGALGKKGI